jgi:hypothetical protein
VSESTIVSRVGIVDAVAARRDSGEVKYLVASVRFETEIEDEYSYSDKKRVDNVDIAVPVAAGVNPGDVVELHVQFISPFGQRFQPALTVSESDEETVDA